MSDRREQPLIALAARSRAAAILVAVLLLFTNAAEVAEAQVFFDPRPVLLQIIQQWQTGFPDRTWYGFEVWQTFSSLTSGTGMFLPLMELGPATEVRINQEAPQPQGVIWQMTAEHQHGVSNWLLGYSGITKRIEMLYFHPGPERQNIPNFGGPGQTVGPPAFLPQPRQEPSAPLNLPPDGGSGCKKYPSLCN